MSPWPRHCITNYTFDVNENTKLLWFDSFKFYSSFNGNISILPCAYFKLTVTEVDESENVISEVYDFVAIQFVFDLPSPYAVSTRVHNVDAILTLSIYDFFQFSELLASDDWIEDIYDIQ